MDWRNSVENVREFFHRVFRRTPVERVSHRGPQTLNHRDPFWGFTCPEQDADMTCPICLDIYHDPVRIRSLATGIYACSHVFCRSCASQHITKYAHRECPVCRQLWDPPLAAVDFSEARQMVEKISVLCKLCGQIIPYHQREAHRSRCPDDLVTNPRMVHCDRCSEDFPTLYHRKLHEESCARTTLASCRCCNRSMPASDLFEHERNCEDFSTGSETNINANGPGSANELIKQSLLMFGVLALGVVSVGLCLFLATVR